MHVHRVSKKLLMNSWLYYVFTGFRMAKPIDELWEKLSKSDSTSLLKQYLTPDVYAKLKDKKTSLGGTLAHCINSGKYTLPATY